MQSFC